VRIDKEKCRAQELVAIVPEAESGINGALGRTERFAKELKRLRLLENPIETVP
jgi:hypothetical protein